MNFHDFLGKNGVISRYPLQELELSIAPELQRSQMQQLVDLRDATSMTEILTSVSTTKMVVDPSELSVCTYNTNQMTNI